MKLGIFSLWTDARKHELVYGERAEGERLDGAPKDGAMVDLANDEAKGQPAKLGGEHCGHGQSGLAQSGLAQSGLAQVGVGQRGFDGEERGGEERDTSGDWGRGHEILIAAGEGIVPEGSSRASRRSERPRRNTEPVLELSPTPPPALVGGVGPTSGVRRTVPPPALGPKASPAPPSSGRGQKARCAVKVGDAASRTVPPPPAKPARAKRAAKPRRRSASVEAHG